MAESAHKSESRYRSLLENIPQRVFFKDKDLVYLAVSAGYARDLNLLPGDFVGRTDYDLFPRELAEKYRRDDRRIMESMLAEELDERFVVGEVERNVRTLKAPMFGDDGKVSGVLGIFGDITERDRAQRELAFKSALLEAQSETSPDGILFVDNQEHPMPLNKRFGEMWNVPADLLASIDDMPLCEFNAGQVRNRDEFLAKIVYLNTHHDEKSYDQLELKDGRFFDRYSSPLVGSKGEDFGRIWYFRDVTDRRKAEQALREGEERFRTVIETSPDAIISFDLEGRMLVANREAARFAGVDSVEELKARKINIFDMLAPEEHSRVRQNIQSLIEKDVLRDVEHTAISVDGVRRPIEVSSSLYRDSQGNPKAIIAVFRDTMRRKRAEEALRKSEAKFRGIAERSLDAIFTTDMDGAVTYISPAVEKFLQYTPEEMIGRAFTAFLAEDEAPQISQALLKHMKRGRGELFETTVLKKDGSRAVVEINAAYVVEHKKIVGGQGILHDVTERKQVQEALERAKEAAEAANRAKSEFLANMSHEIRTPMTSILGFTDLLMTPNLSQQEREEFLQTIRRNGKALMELIGEILDLSKIEAEKMSLEPVDCSALRIVEDVVSTMRVQAVEKGLGLDVDYLSPLPETIRTDPVRLRQILVNLVGNAIKFTECGGVRIALDCKRRADGVPFVRFVVSDSGVGIPPEKIADLFRPFTQADASTTRRYGGTGLGLAISKRLANMLGGDIQVLSELGKGSTFTLTINPGPLEGVGTRDMPAEPCTTAVPAALAGETPAPQVALGGDTAAELTEAFAAELSTRSQFIQKALRDRNLDLLARLTHQLAGTAAIYGFARVSDAAHAIHKQVTEEEALQQIEATVAELAELCVFPPKNAPPPDGPASLARSAGES